MQASSPSASSSTPDKEDRHFVTALARGLDVLSCFRSGDKALGNQEIAKRCKLPKSTVSRLTYTLTKLGYLIQMEESGKYRLGTATLALGSYMMARLDVRQLAKPMMEELAEFAKATVSLGTRDRLAMLYVENCRSSASLTLSVDIGSRIPIINSAIGRAYLAVTNEAERNEILERVREYDEQAWPAIDAAIRAAREDYRTLGCTRSFGDLQPHVNGIAAAFNPGGGLPVMAISCAGPAFSLSQDFLLQEVRPRLIELVRKLEASAGRV
ncbi:MAG TPA: IclR family transcriptional regulator [Aquabacterium sp.]|nr:IclR family transcriptional regulator [Aquabacterium sp.]